MCQSNKKSIHEKSYMCELDSGKLVELEGDSLKSTYLRLLKVTNFKTWVKDTR